MAASLKIALANVLLGAAGVFWLAALVRRQLAWRTGALYIPVALYAIASLAAVAFSQNPGRSLSELPGVLTIALVPMTVTLIDAQRWDRLLLMLTAVASASSVVGLWQYLHGASDLDHRLHGLANHYMTFSGWTLLVVLLLLGDIAFSRNRRRLVWTVPALAVCAASLALSLTRGAWVGLSVGLVLAVALRKPVLLLLSPLVVGLVIVVVPQPVVARAVSILDLEHPSNYDRLCMVDAGLEMVRDHPVFGVGLGMVKPSYQRYRPDDAPRPRVPHLHNNPLQIAAERGLVGLAAYLAILIVFGAQAGWLLRRRGDPDAATVAGCLLAVAGITVAGLFEYNWGDAEVWILTLVCLSVPSALAPVETV